MAAAPSSRIALLLIAAASFAAVTTAFALYEVPGLGIGHFYYVGIAAGALATNGRGGAAAGIVATGCFATAVLINPVIPPDELLTRSAGIRLITFVGMGILVGWFSAHNRSLVARLRDLAERDFLTGLRNLRSLDDELERRCAGAQPFALVLGDVDGLKEINELRGQAEGDALLRRAASVLSDLVGETGSVARVGGDEFAVITPIGDAQQAEVFVARLEEELDGRRVRTSFGAAIFPLDASSPLALYRLADERLASAKLGRRARLTINRLLSGEFAGGRG
jgi:diguanylate cyclase (GGDEF)-like protein